MFLKRFCSLILFFRPLAATTNVFQLEIFHLTRTRSSAAPLRAATSSRTDREAKVTASQPPPSRPAASFGRWGSALTTDERWPSSPSIWSLTSPPQFHITKENRGNEGTCVGVSRWPVRDHNHHTTTDMWLYRAYSGNLYHGGELVRTLPSFTQGDTITCILDMEAHTVSFAKNDKVERQVFFFSSPFFFFAFANNVFHFFCSPGA